jgi:hypothetical protein
MWMLGLALTLPMILLAGPLAGFLVGQFILVKQFGLPPATAPIAMVVGLIGSGLQTIRLIQKLKQTQKEH